MQTNKNTRATFNTKFHLIVIAQRQQFEQTSTIALVGLKLNGLKKKKKHLITI